MSMTHLVVSEQPPRIQYVANGINQIFETPFPIFRKTAIQVFINDAEVNPTDYTVVLNIKLHATITFRLAPEQNSIITLVRNLPIERVSDFQEGGELRADTLNYEFNYQNACLQQLSDNLNRSMVMPPYAIDPKIKLTLPNPKAGKSIMWSADGQSLVNSEVEINKISTELNEKVVIATTAADTASANASVATEQADIATEKAMRILEMLNNIVHTDLANLSDAGRLAIITCMLPDWSTAVSCQATTTGTIIPYNGILFGWGINPAAATCIVSINNVNISQEATDFANIQIPVSAGDLVKVSGGNGDFKLCKFKGYML